MALVDAHSMDPVKVLRTAAAMGARMPHVIIVGCQPASPAADDADGCETLTGMSAPVTIAADEAVAMVESLVQTLSADKASGRLNCNPQEVST